jgi:hypothetical protein
MTTTPDAFRAAVLAHLFLVRMVSVCGTCGGHGVVRDLPPEVEVCGRCRLPYLEGRVCSGSHFTLLCAPVTVRGGPVQEQPCPTCAEVRDWLAAWDSHGPQGASTALDRPTT